MPEDIIDSLRLLYSQHHQDKNDILESAIDEITQLRRDCDALASDVHPDMCSESAWKAWMRNKERKSA